MIYQGFQYREMFDGKLFVPNQGKLPPCPPKYQRTIDPYIFTPELSPCLNRVEEKQQTPCCVKIVTRCSHFNKIILPKDCQQCQLIQLSQ